MNIWLKRLRLTLLLMLSAAASATVLAQPIGLRALEHLGVRAFYTQNSSIEKNAQEIEQQSQQQNDRRRQRESGVSESSGFSGQGENPANNSADLSRKQGKLSPEERRALRRQIDEAGHDIYAPKR